MRLVDANKLKQDHFMSDECETCINDVGRCQNWHSYTKMDFCGWIDNAPTVDAIEVVRCKDCQFFHKYGFKLEYTECIHFDCEVAEDGYCYWAKRREDE